MKVLALVLGIQVVWALVESYSAARYCGNRPAIPAYKRAGVSRLPVTIGVVSAILAAVVILNAIGKEARIEEIVPSAFLAVSGILLRFLAIRELGPWFRNSIDLEPGQIRVKSGPYRWLRHPAEVGFLLIFAGFLILIHSVFTVALFALLVALIGIRVLLEERLFREKS